MVFEFNVVDGLLQQPGSSKNNKWQALQYLELISTPLGDQPCTKNDGDDKQE